MKLFQVPIISLYLLFCIGCDVLNHSQFLVTPAHQNDEKKASTIVRRVALENSLKAESTQSSIPSVLGFYTQPQPHFPISLGSRRIPDSIIFDISQFHPGVSSTPTFDKIALQLERSLRQSFGERLKIPERKDFVSIP
jgi:hypothetical protein